METKKEISKELKFKGNPRKISERQRDLLKSHIEELGDLSGVVYCHNQKSYVGGNQRSDILNGSAIEIVETYKKPNEVGTVAYGFINHNNERFAYREVNFTEDQFKKACIVANNDGGENDWNMLADSYWNNDELEEWGLDVPISTEIDNSLEGDLIEIPKSLQVIPKKEYILIMADSDSEEWDELRTIFKCGTVRMGGCTIGSSSDKVGRGLERVFDLKTFKERLKL